VWEDLGEDGKLLFGEVWGFAIDKVMEGGSKEARSLEEGDRGVLGVITDRCVIKEKEEE
jgi:hypothetical protein